MKIIFISTGISASDQYPNPNFGGQVQIWGLAKELVRKGHTIGIIRASSHPEYKQTIDGVELINIKPKINEGLLFGILPSFIFSLRILQSLKVEKPDILVSRFRFSSFFASFLSIPHVYVLASPDALRCMRKHSVRYSFFNYPLFFIKNITEIRVMKNSRKIIVLNEYMKHYLKEEFSEEHVIKLSNGINPNIFYNNGDDDFILFSPGRFDWNKRVNVILQAYFNLDDELKKQYRLILVGHSSDPRINEFVQEFIRSNSLEKYVEIIPWLERDELIKLMSKCSVFVLTSLFEMFPNVIIEAMSSGKTVIASNIPGPQDIISHSRDGFLFERNDIDELTRHIQLVLRNRELRYQIGENAKKSMCERYSFDFVSDSYLALFNEVIKND
jgi:glycosyltransferase involved in cell wall biosynthesis